MVLRLEVGATWRRQAGSTNKRAGRNSGVTTGWHHRHKKAEVTGGGISLAEVDPRTLESRRARGLYICGEVLDAFGPIGGYNFLCAWATGSAPPHTPFGTA